MIVEVLAPVLLVSWLWSLLRMPREELAAVPEEPRLPDPISFKPGEPQSFAEFNAQQTAVGLIEDAIGALGEGQMAIKDQMFAGSAGGGKTLMAKLVAQALRDRTGTTQFIEAMDVNTEEGLDAIMWEAVRHPGSVVFFDEIHTLAGYKHLIKLYLALDERRYHFKGHLAPTALPPVTFLSATTDYGALPEPFKRRWIIHFFEPYTKEQLKGIILGRGIAIEPDAADLILARTHHGGAPWEAVQILELADNAARARQALAVTVAHVERVLALYQIDALGLRLIDRRAIQGLFRMIKRKVNGEWRYAASEANVALMARIDKAEFLATVRPKLISRGLMEMVPWWGHCLTTRAIDLYEHLKETNE